MLSSENAYGPCPAYGWFVTASLRSRVLREFSAMFPNACDRDESDGVATSSKVPNYMSRLREEPPSEEGSSA